MSRGAAELNGKIRHIVLRIDNLIDDDFRIETLKQQLARLYECRSQCADVWDHLSAQMVRIDTAHKRFMQRCKSEPTKLEPAMKSLYSKLRRRYGSNSDPENWDIPPLFAEPQYQIPTKPDHEPTKSSRISYKVFKAKYHFHARPHMTLKGAQRHLDTLEAVLEDQLSLQSLREQRIKELEQQREATRSEIECYNKEFNKAHSKWIETNEEYAEVVRKFFVQQKKVPPSEPNLPLTTLFADMVDRARLENPDILHQTVYANDDKPLDAEAVKDNIGGDLGDEATWKKLLITELKPNGTSVVE